MQCYSEALIKISIKAFAIVLVFCSNLFRQIKGTVVDISDGDTFPLLTENKQSIKGACIWY